VGSISSVIFFRHPGHWLVCPSPFFFYERVSDLLVVTNSSVNFVIYCLCSRRFRAALINLICRKQALPNRLVTAVVSDNKPSPDERRGTDQLKPLHPQPNCCELQPAIAE